jgi:hypothetical protein
MRGTGLPHVFTSKYYPRLLGDRVNSINVMEFLLCL